MARRAAGAADSQDLPRRLGKGGRWPGILIIILIPALLLYLPVFYYSLTTPLGLVDDYQDWQFVALLDSPARLLRWRQGVFYAGRRQWETSGIIAAGFMLLLAATLRQHWRRRVCRAQNYGV